MSSISLAVLALSLVAAVTTVACGVMIWYTKSLLGDMTLMASDLQALKEMLEDYCTHVESVYEMEMFYGDETLQNLMRHSRAIVDEIKINEYDFSPAIEDGDGENTTYAEKENENQEALLYESS